MGDTTNFSSAVDSTQNDTVTTPTPGLVAKAKNSETHTNTPLKLAAPVVKLLTTEKFALKSSDLWGICSLLNVLDLMKIKVRSNVLWFYVICLYCEYCNKCL